VLLGGRRGTPEKPVPACTPGPGGESGEGQGEGGAGGVDEERKKVAAHKT